MSYVKHPDQRVAVFVDVSNMFHAAKREGATLNFAALLREAVAGRKLVRAIAYAVKSDSEEEKAFFDALQEAGFEVRLKDLKIFTSGKKKGDWDVGIVVDMIAFGDSIDAAVLVSGDGDYVPAIEYLRTRGRLVEVVSFGEGTAAELIEAADDFLDMSQHPRRFLMRGRGNSRRSSAARRSSGGSSRRASSSRSGGSSPRRNRSRGIFGTDETGEGSIESSGGSLGGNSMR